MFDDLTTPQPERVPLSPEEAGRFVRQQSGILFDLVLAELFVKVVG